MRIAALISSALLLSGCGTIESKSKGGWGRPYTGVSCSASYVSKAAEGDRYLAPIPAIDTFLSAIFDTLLLPADLIVNASSDKRKKKSGDCYWR